MMRSWLIIIASLVICTRTSQSLWRIFHISASDNSSQESRCVDNCYTLQDVIHNQSNFFDSHTTLELTPGKYDITENVGQIVIANVQHFILRPSTTNQFENVTIFCHPNATFGISVVSSFNVTISGLQLINCSARLHVRTVRVIKEALGPTLLNDVIDDRFYFNAVEITEYLVQWLHNKTVCEQAMLPCIATLFLVNNKAIYVQQTAILHSQHIGILAVKNPGMTIKGLTTAFNSINAIIYVNLLNNYTDNTTISDCSFTYGQSTNIRLSSGLNLGIETYPLSQKSVSCTKLANFTFENNKGGNFFLDIRYFDLAILYFSLRNMSVISEYPYPTNGLVLHFDTHFADCGHPDHDINDFKLYIEDATFQGTCMVTIGGVLEMRRIILNYSRCSEALSIRDTCHDTIATNITISNSTRDIFYTTRATVHFSGHNYFIGNNGSFIVQNGRVTFGKIKTTFAHNSASKYNGVLVSASSKIAFFGAIAVFKFNKGKTGGALVAYRSTIFYSHSKLLYYSNSGDNGGALSLREGSTIKIITKVKIYILENKAKYYGGGIFVENKQRYDGGGIYFDEYSYWIKYTSNVNCFVQMNKNLTKNILFSNNTAGLAGHALFGGWIDICVRANNFIPSQIFDLTFRNSRRSFTDISSTPSRICMCNNMSAPNTSKISETFTVFPGQTLEMKAVAVGQRFGIVPALVEAKVLENNDYSIIHDIQIWQNLGKECTLLQYTIRSPNEREAILLTVNYQNNLIPTPYQNQSFPELAHFRINVIVKDCPLGFIFDTDRNVCVCHYLLTKERIQCNTVTVTIIRKPQQWISAKTTNTIAVHYHCPHDYCKSQELSLNLSTPDDQCFFNRSGTLCGDCRSGYSQVLGTSGCKKCSNIWLLLLLPFFLAGVALVVCLMKLNITVSTGTINGLVFYANILRANTAIFFPGRAANTFLNGFIAWLNLDVGIETCFYNGLTAYAKTWLQFIFPLYIWALAFVIIIASHYSTRASKLCGNNSVQVLATLFFLSYAKLLRVIITVFQPTRLLILDNTFERVETVWNYDGNLDYLKGRHLSLFVITLSFFSLFFIPYTLVIFTIQWLQIFSQYRALCWVAKLKPLFDAYTGPYKDKHRYWTGLLLLLRTGLFCAFSVNTTGDPAVNLLVIITVMVCLFVHLALTGGVYKSWPLDLLEYIFYLNITILSAGTLYARAVDKSVDALSQASVGIAFCITVFIVLCHAVHTFATKFDMKVKFRTLINHKVNKKDINAQQNDIQRQKNVTYSVVEMEEKLL